MDLKIIVDLSQVIAALTATIALIVTIFTIKNSQDLRRKQILMSFSEKWNGIEMINHRIMADKFIEDMSKENHEEFDLKNYINKNQDIWFSVACVSHFLVGINSICEDDVVISEKINKYVGGASYWAQDLWQIYKELGAVEDRVSNSLMILYKKNKILPPRRLSWHDDPITAG